METIPTTAEKISTPRMGFASRVRPLEFGLVNNMPDSALVATERQFGYLLRSVTGSRPYRLTFYSIGSVPRSADGRTAMAGRYRDISQLPTSGLDALIVTGMEPKAKRLVDEPYWDDFETLADWAARNTRSTIWSCLAAHAAVLHFDGIERTPLAQKCSGIFECASIAKGQGSECLTVAHSRWNTVLEDQLIARNYNIISRSEFAGVDSFTKGFGSKFVFFQGHPEYDVTALPREYNRDVNRFLTGERKDYPEIPFGCFDNEAEQELRAFRAAAERHRGMSGRELPRPAPKPEVAARTATSARRIYTAWVDQLSAEAVY